MLFIKGFTFLFPLRNANEIMLKMINLRLTGLLLRLFSNRLDGVNLLFCGLFYPFDNGALDARGEVASRDDN